MQKRLLTFLTILGIISAFAMYPDKGPGAAKYARFHDPDQLLAATHKMTQLLDSGQYFLTPSNCEGCHGHDLLGLANVDGIGNDINLFDSWQTSMMGLAGVDPLWRAKVRHEILTNPGHSAELQNLCTRCHAPMAHYTALFHGQSYNIASVDTDSLALAGVGCGGCHSISPVGLGSTFTGIIPYDTNRVEYGPFDNPFVGPMQLYVGITPAKGAHMDEGRVCSPCHTLISHSVDLNGQLTGNSFVEQATFHEWVNSDFPAQQIKCQTCHMPQLEDPIKIANGYTALQARSPFNMHTFAGSNAFMVNLIKQNKASLGVLAPDKNFDSTLAHINRQLRYHSDSVKIVVDTVLNDTLYARVGIANKTGHKFPSGYPSRRAVLQLVATKSNGDTVFASGMFDSTMEVVQIDSIFEPHYDIIKSPDQVQIYEMVMGDINGDRTTVLERANVHLKDNRIPPLGFSSQHANYDTCEIVGVPSTDLDFNKIGTVEGSGMDVVHFHIALNGYRGQLKLFAGVYYQLLPPSWLKEMFTWSAPEIDHFKTMYQSADKNPILTGSDSITGINLNTGISSLAKETLRISPNPTYDGWIKVQLPEGAIPEFKLYSLSGKLVSIQVTRIDNVLYKIKLPDATGCWILQVIRPGLTVSKKVMSW